MIITSLLLMRPIKENLYWAVYDNEKHQIKNGIKNLILSTLKLMEIYQTGQRVNNIRYEKMFQMIIMI